MARRVGNQPVRVAVIRDAIVVGISLGVAIVAAQQRVFSELVASMDVPIWLAIVVAGVMYSSIFTVAPATVAFTQLATFAPVTEVVVLAGLGAMLGDAVVFRFFQGAIAAWVAQHRSARFFNWPKRLQWWAIIAGAIIIASPLPDEIGIALMGLTPLQQRWFFPLSFGLNSAGILIIVLVGKYG